MYEGRHRHSTRIPAETVTRYRRPVCEAVRVADEPTRPIAVKPTVPPPVWPLPRPEVQAPVVASKPVPVVRRQVPVPLPAREPVPLPVSEQAAPVSSGLSARVARLVANAGRWVRRG